MENAIKFLRIANLMTTVMMRHLEEVDVAVMLASLTAINTDTDSFLSNHFLLLFLMLRYNDTLFLCHFSFTYIYIYIWWHNNNWHTHKTTSKKQQNNKTKKCNRRRKKVCLSCLNFILRGFSWWGETVFMFGFCTIFLFHTVLVTLFSFNKLPAKSKNVQQKIWCPHCPLQC